MAKMMHYLFGCIGNMMNVSLFYGIFMMFFWVLIIILIAYILFKLLRKEGLSFNKSDDTISILKRRYARGEISKKEYEQMRKESK